MAVCRTRSIDLNNDMLKVLGTHFSYNQKLKVEKIIYKSVRDIQGVIKMCKVRNLTLEWKIVILTTIKLSKIVLQSFITAVSNIL